MQYATIDSDYFCGIDLHSRTMYVCIMDKMGEVLFRQNQLATMGGLEVATSLCSLHGRSV